MGSSPIRHSLGSYPKGWLPFVLRWNRYFLFQSGVEVRKTGQGMRYDGFINKGNDLEKRSDGNV